MTSIAIAENGRVLIPSEIRDQLGIKPKTRLHVEIKNGSLILTPATQHYANLRAYFDSVLQVPEGISLSEELVAQRHVAAKTE